MKTGAFILLITFSLVSCKVTDKPATIGSIDRVDESLNDLIDPAAALEVLADGYDWSEGPVWIESQKMLLFSDVPKNTVYKWTEDDGVKLFLKPSGYTGSTSSNSAEEGSNGLAVDAQGRLVLCQHGDRRLARMDAPLNAPRPLFSTLADNYQGKKLNSPNDVAIRGNGDLFFTDPPYGMPKDVPQETPFQGVYKVSGGKLTLLIDSISRPNGIAFMPGEKTLIIANSDPAKAVWYAYDLGDDDSVVNGRIFYAVAAADKAEQGNPDGLKIDRNGNVFATGPGGIWIFDRSAKLLGRIKIPAATANCAFSEDQKTLFITADSYLLRLKMKP